MTKRLCVRGHEFIPCPGESCLYEGHHDYNKETRGCHRDDGPGLMARELCGQREAAPRPRIVCLCGSTRFYSEFQRQNYLKTMAGEIVLSVGFYRPSPESEAERDRYERHGENIGCTPEQKVALDELHKKKIDLADYVLVLNVGGYIGESTQSEIYHALRTGKRVDYLEPMPMNAARIADLP